MIQYQDISKRYTYKGGEVLALDSINLQIEAGELTAICGKSGSGKSTLLNLIGCLDDPSSGQIFVNQEALPASSSKKAAHFRNTQVGFVMQDFSLIENESVWFNIMLPILYGKQNLNEAKAKAKQLLEKVDLGGLDKKLVNQLSGGQKQRVAIARALITDAPILLADEPTGQLDTQTAQQIMDIFKELNHAGKTILIVTHDQEIASQCRRVITLSDGHII